jgi:DNA-directed RNA polymerase subunit beta
MPTLTGKKITGNHFFRSIGYERDKDILEIFDLADEVKVSKAALKKFGKKTCRPCA